MRSAAPVVRATLTDCVLPRACCRAWRPERVNLPPVPMLSLQLVNKIHEQFMDSLVEVFNLHKGAYGWAHKSLVIR